MEITWVFYYQTKKLDPSWSFNQGLKNPDQRFTLQLLAASQHCGQLTAYVITIWTNERWNDRRMDAARLLFFSFFLASQLSWAASGTRSCLLAAEWWKPGFMDVGTVFNCELAAAGPCLIDGVRLPADVWDISGPVWKDPAAGGVGSSGQGGFEWLTSTHIRTHTRTHTQRCFLTNAHLPFSDYAVFCIFLFTFLVFVLCTHSLTHTPNRNSHARSAGNEWHSWKIRPLSDLHRGRLHSRLSQWPFSISAPSAHLPARSLPHIPVIMFDPLQADWGDECVTGTMPHRLLLMFFVRPRRGPPSADIWSEWILSDSSRKSFSLARGSISLRCSPAAFNSVAGYTQEIGKGWEILETFQRLTLIHCTTVNFKINLQKCLSGSILSNLITLSKHTRHTRGRQPFGTRELPNGYSVIQVATTSLHFPDITSYLSLFLKKIHHC